MKRILSTVLVFVMLVAMTPVVSASEPRNVSYEESLAADLKELGLFKGVSDTNFNLGRAPSRIEALVMLVRVLGKEQEALNADWRHPFTDVPQWADKYVGFAYQNGLTNGVTATEFGSNNADARTYLTFVLRALGYSDANGQDFTWDQPYALASEIGILVDRVDLDNFWRADVVIISYAALPVQLKNSDQTLAEKLIAAGAFTQEQFNASFDPNFLKNVPNNNTATEEKPPEAPPVQPSPPQTESPAVGTKLSSQEIAEKCSKAVFLITCYAFNGEICGSGSGFFISPSGLAVTNYHVIANCSMVTITMSDGTVYEKVFMIDGSSALDLALLRVHGSDFPYMELSDSDALKQGQRVYAIGSPLGLDNTMSEGIISNVKRVIKGTEYIQISVPIAPGSSGGALIDEYGKVVGVTTAGFVDSTGDLNLAVGSNWISTLNGEQTQNFVFWDLEYYTNFYQIPDFGAFTGMTLLDYKWVPWGYVCIYDALDCHDSPGYTAAENFANTLYYYHSALLKNGFELKNNASMFKDWYIASEEQVYVDASMKDDPYIFVFVYWIPQYYAEAPKLPSLSWYLAIDEDTPDQANGSWVWFYRWSQYYTEEDFLFLLDLYFGLLKDLGFQLVYQQGTDALFEGNGLSVVISYDDQNVTLDVLPTN